MNKHVVYGLSPILDIGSLSPDYVTAARHNISRGDTASLGHANTRVGRRDRIQGAQAALDRTRLFICIGMSWDMRA